MDSRKIVWQETGIVALGEGICLALMLAVCALLGFFNRSVILGGVVGTLLAVANFFFMAVNVCSAADKAAGQDVKGGKSMVKFSYSARMIALFVILFACVKSGYCNVFTSVLPLAFVRPILTLAEFFRKDGAKKA